MNILVNFQVYYNFYPCHSLTTTKNGDKYLFGDAISLPTDSSTLMRII